MAKRTCRADTARIILRTLDWAEYLPRGIRKAWCELTGGHDDEMLSAWASMGLPFAVKMHCSRCGRETRWHYTQVNPKANRPPLSTTGRGSE